MKPTKAQLALLEKLTTRFAYSDNPWPYIAFRKQTVEVCLRNGWVKLFKFQLYNPGAVCLTPLGRAILEQYKEG